MASSLLVAKNNGTKGFQLEYSWVHFHILSLLLNRFLLFSPQASLSGASLFPSSLPDSVQIYIIWCPDLSQFVIAGVSASLPSFLHFAL